MPKNQSVTLMSFSISDINTSQDLLNLLGDFEYSEENGIGFSNLTIESEKYLSATAVKRSPIFIKVLNPETQQLVKREEFIISQIDFAFDLDTKILEIFAPQKDLRKFFSVYNSTIRSNIKIKEFDINTSSSAQLMKSSMDKYEFKKMTIKDFKHEEGVIGTYDIRILNNQKANNFIEQYKNEIVKIVIAFSIQDLSGYITFSNNCNFKIQMEYQSGTTQVLSLFKQQINNFLQN